MGPANVETAQELAGARVLDARRQAAPSPAPAATSTGRAHVRRVTLLWLVALAVLYLGLALPRLTRVPRVIMDESWEATTGWSLAFEGHLRNPVILDRAGMDRAFVQPRIVQSVVLAGMYRVAGFSLTSGRLASVLIGLLAVWGVFYLLRTWVSPGAAGLGALLLLAESEFFLVARVVRPEIYLLCAGVWMLALLARGVTGGRVRTCLAAGVVGGIGCYIHPNMALIILPSIPLIFWQLGLCRRTWAALTAYGLGGVVGVLPFLVWVAYAQAQHGVSLLAQLGDWYVSGVGGEYDTLSREWYRWWNYLRLPYRGPWVLIVIVSMVASLLWRHPIGVWGLAQTAGHAILFPLFIRKGSPHYLVVLSPWLAALVALWASRLWSRAAPATGALRRRGLQALAIGSVAVTLAVHMAGNLYLLHRYRHANYDGTCARVAQSIEPGSRVYGTLVFWTGLHQYPFLGDVGEWVLPAGEVKDRLRARLVAFRPQYIVRGSDLCWTLAGFGPRQQEFTRDLWRTIDRPRWEALQNLCTDSYLKQHGAVLLDKFETYDFGTIEVHELHW